MTKTEFMLIGSRQSLSNLTESTTFSINDVEVSQGPTAKSLGVTIDDRLDWSGHIEKVTKKVASVINWGNKTIKAPCPSGDLTTNISSFNTATL